MEEMCLGRAVAEHRQAAEALLRDRTAIAETRGSCSCEKCRACCHNMPGWFLPGEMERAAAELGVTPDEFMDKYGTVDYWVGDPLGLPIGRWETRVAAPRAEGWRRGLAAFQRPAAKCLLLGENGCRLSHATRPYECRVAYACLPEEGRRAYGYSSGYSLRNAIAIEWRAEEHQSAMVAHG